MSLDLTVLSFDGVKADNKMIMAQLIKINNQLVNRGTSSTIISGTIKAIKVSKARKACRPVLSVISFA